MHSRRDLAVALLAPLLLALGVVTGPPPLPGAAPQGLALPSAAPRSPLFFVENQGQFPAEVFFVLRAGSQTVWLTRTGVVFDLNRDANPPVHDAEPRSRAMAQLDRSAAPRDRLVFTQEFLGARPELQAEGRRPVGTRVNYLLGDDPSAWCTGVPAFSEVVLPDVYPEIDYRLFATGHDLEQEFIVRPGGDPSAIRVAFRDVEGLEIEPDGSLVVHTLFGPLREREPVVYKDRLGERTGLPAAYRLVGERSYGFDVVVSDRELALVIDPRLEFSTFLGGSDHDYVLAVGLTPDERPVVGGQTQSPNLPAQGGFQNAYQGNADGFVARLDPAGTSFEFLSYLGGSGDDSVYALKIHPTSGAVCLTGYTAGGIVPTPDAFQGTFGGGGQDAFLAVLDSEASGFTYFSYLGGNQSDRGFSLSLDGLTAIYLVGMTSGGTFPLKQPVQPAPGGNWDAFIARFDLSVPNAVSFSSVLGGSSYDEGRGVATDAAGNAVLTGATSGGFPTTVGAYDRSYNGAGPQDVFVTKLTREGGLLFSTYLGGAGSDSGRAITIDDVGNVLVCGYTTAGGQPFPTKNALGGIGGGEDAFLAILNSTGSTLLYSTPIGGNGSDVAEALSASGPHNTVVIGGVTRSSNFPASPEAVQPVMKGNSSAFLSLIDTSASRILYSTFLGGGTRSPGAAEAESFFNQLATTPCGDIVAVGSTTCTDFPTTDGVIQQTHSAGVWWDGFVGRFSLGSQLTVEPAAVRPNKTGDVTIRARSCHPLAAISVVLQLPAGLSFDSLQPTAFNSQVDLITAGSIGGSHVSIAIVADNTDPITRTIDLTENPVIAKVRLSAGNFTAPAVFSLAIVPEATTTPPQFTEFVRPGAATEAITPVLIESELSIAGFFTRGDANFDKRVSISDIVFILYGLFVHAGATFTCLDAVDANDDNLPNVTDVVYLVSYIFQGGPAPPPPAGPTCGVDATSPIREVDCLRGCP